MRYGRETLIGAAIFLTTLAASAQPVLTGAIAFETDNTGLAVGGYFNTVGGDYGWNLYVIQGPPGGAFVNSGNAASTSISIPLPPGTYTITMQSGHFQTQSYRGLNLFFGGEEITPSISVFEANGVTGGQPDGNATRTLDGEDVGNPGANTLVANVSGYRVRLSNFRAQTSGTASDRVSSLDNAPDGTDDDIITFTLEVDPAPIPALGAAGLAALALLLACAGFVALRRLG